MSVLSLVTHLPKSKTFEKREVSSANILHIKVIPSGRSFKRFRNKNDPNTDSCGTSELSFLQQDV